MTIESENSRRDFPEQLRDPIYRGAGATETERQLAKLAERSFLNLWSYPNLYRYQKVGGVGDGKELCDLLVVCGQHVIIFSEKNIAWTDANANTAWRRWFKRAIKNSADQLKGAERWLTDYPDRVFLDKDCTQSFPISIPDASQRILHKVVVARGAGDACIQFFSGGSGSLVLDTAIVGDDHLVADEDALRPFHIGDIDPQGSFIHVLDDATLGIVLSELDTVTDFTDYLTKKSRFIRSGHFVAAHGEEDLLAYYMTRTDEFGEHDFFPPNAEKWTADEKIAIDGSHYVSMASNPQYIAKKEADRGSYIWDALIENFTNHILDGTSIVLDGSEYDLGKNEVAVRYMALENRLSRRVYGEAISEAMRKSFESDRFFRIMISTQNGANAETGFFFLSLKYLDWMEQHGYMHYRYKRQELLGAYSQGILLKFPYLKRVVGIAVEPPREGGGGSEDLMVVEPGEWSEDHKRSINETCERLGILQGNLAEHRKWADEFPSLNAVREKIPPRPKRRFSRKQRKAAKLKKL